MASDSRELSFRILLESNPEVLTDLEKKFREVQDASQAFTSNLNLGLSINLWDLAFDQLRKFPQALNEAAQRGEEMANQMATAKRELSYLGGEAGQTRQRLDALLALADHPSWSLPGLTTGASALDGFSNGLLSTADRLGWVGDIATGTGQDFTAMATQVGAAFEAISRGQGLEGPLQALTQMGAISAQTKADLLAMQLAGESSSAMWARLEGELDHFNGSLERLRETSEGAEARVKNLFDQVLGRVAAAYLAQTSGSARDLADALEDMDTTSLEHMADQLGTLVSALKSGVGWLTQFSAGGVFVAKILGALGLIAAGRKFAALTAQVMRTIQAKDAFRRSLHAAALTLKTTEAELMSYLRGETSVTAATVKAAQAKAADTLETERNTSATVANTAAKVANAKATQGQAGMAGLSAGRRTATDLQKLPTGARPLASAGKLATLTTGLRGLGTTLASVGRGLTALVGGIPGLLLLLAAVTKAAADWAGDKIIARLDRQEKLENTLARQNGQLTEQLRNATSMEQLQEVRKATEQQLLDLEREKKDASDDTLKLIEMTEAGARARLKLIEQEGQELVSINAQIKKAADEEERRNAALQARLKHYEENKDRYASEMADYRWERTPDQDKLNQLAGQVRDLTSQYAAANGGKPITDMMAEAKRIEAQRAAMQALPDDDPMRDQFMEREKLWNSLTAAQKSYEEVSGRLAASDKSAADRAFAVDQLRQQLAADQARLAGNEALARVLEDQMRLARETREIMSATGEEEARAAEIARERLQTEQAITTAQQARVRRAALDELLQQLTIDQARLAGQEELARQLEAERTVRRDIADIMQRTGMSEARATALAQERLRVAQELAGQQGRSARAGEALDKPARTGHLSLAERARRGLDSFTRTGAASVGMTPGWMDTAEDRVLGRNAYAPRPLAVSATLAGQFGLGQPAPAPQPTPAASSAAASTPTGEKITAAAAGAAATLDLVEGKTAAAIDHLGQQLAGKFTTVNTKLTALEAQLRDLRN